MSLGDLQACPWCAFVGTPTMFDLHIETHERDRVIREIDNEDVLILDEIAAERLRQHDKWGEQNHPDGTGSTVVGWIENLMPFHWRADKSRHIAMLAQAHCERMGNDDRLTWLDIALEEMAEAFAETDETKLRAELIQAAAVLVNWIGAIDRRRKKEKDQYDLDQQEQNRPNPRLM